jgi:hypothetical protein
MGAMFSIMQFPTAVVAGEVKDMLASLVSGHIDFHVFVGENTDADISRGVGKWTLAYDSPSEKYGGQFRRQLYSQAELALTLVLADKLAKCLPNEQVLSCWWLKQENRPQLAKLKLVELYA